ncbi:MAG: hypothetical protein ACP6KW_03170 [Candidatus Thorarchaeota archaeon]
MISSERTQNTIVAVMIIIALTSSVFLVSNAAYYTGSYSLAGGMQVTLVDITASNIDPANASVFPRLAFTFNLKTTSTMDGNVRITFMGAAVTLNDDILSYMPFARTVPLDEQPVHPGYDVNVTLSRTSSTEEDRATIIDAFQTDYWNWTIVFRYSFITFDEAGSIVWDYTVFRVLGVDRIL